MKHVISFSGGKDSTALLLWAIENLAEFIVIFCDTGWEHPITLAYIEEINQSLLGGKLITLRSAKYSAKSREYFQPLRSDATARDRWRLQFVLERNRVLDEQGAFVNMVLARKMIPGVHSRFCTQELKIYPSHTFFESLDDEVTNYQGIRADESKARSTKTKREWVDDAGGYWIERPLLDWSAEDCFALMEKHQVKPNPLYLTGSTRVGCWPCIMTGLGELKRCIQFYPELRQRLIDIERKANDAAADPENYRTWFRSDKIPARFCSKSTVTKDGRTVPLATVEDVFRYIDGAAEGQLQMFEPRSCMSVYNLCE